jgi:cytosine/adenosine deaminase-related metal-dependent hydrolase
MTLTKFEAELRLNEDDMYESMRRRMKSMLTAAHRFIRSGKSKNAGVVAALTAALYEIDDRMEVARSLSVTGPRGDRVADMGRRELCNYYPIIRKMYDQFAAFRLLQPHEVTESTMDSALREERQRERNNPVLVYAHDEGCTIDHTPNGPNGSRKNCPTPEEWDE